MGETSSQFIAVYQRGGGAHLQALAQDQAQRRGLPAMVDDGMLEAALVLRECYAEVLEGLVPLWREQVRDRELTREGSVAIRRGEEPARVFAAQVEVVSRYQAELQERVSSRAWLDLRPRCHTHGMNKAFWGDLAKELRR